MPSMVASVAGGMMRQGFMKYAERTTLEVLTALTDNRKLIGVLTGQFGDYGLPRLRAVSLCTRCS